MTESGAGGTTNRRRWCLILPIANLVVALSLLVVGQYQSRNVSSEHVATMTRSEWTPSPPSRLAPTTQIAYAINFPALLLASPFRFVHGAVIAKCVFLCAVAIIWWIVGLMLDARVPKVSSK